MNRIYFIKDVNIKDLFIYQGFIKIYFLKRKILECFIGLISLKSNVAQNFVTANMHKFTFVIKFQK